MSEVRAPLAAPVVEVIKNGYAKAFRANFHGVSSMTPVELKRERNAGIRQFLSGFAPNQQLVKLYKMTLQREMTFGAKFTDDAGAIYLTVIDEPGNVIAKAQIDGPELKWIG